MNCNDFSNQLAAFRDPREIPETMKKHMASCSHCTRDYDNALRVMHFLEDETLLKVSPFLKTRVMAMLEPIENNSWYTKPALMTVISLIVFIFGLVSAGLLEGSEKINAAEIVASDYYFQDYPGTQLEEIWFNSDYYEE